MHEQKGTFNGLDTCSITNYGNFGFNFNLSTMPEARTINNRPDSNALLTELTKQKIYLSIVRMQCAKKQYEVQTSSILNAINMDQHIYR